MAVVEELDALESAAVHPGEADDLGGERPVRVEAARFGDELEAGHPQQPDRLDLFGGGLAFDPHERFARGELFSHFRKRPLEDARQVPGGGLDVLDLGGADGDGGGVDADGHLAPPAVQDRPAFAHGLEGVLDLVGGFLGKPGTLIDLEQQGFAADHREPDGERDADQQDTQAGEIGFPGLHGNTIICLGAGMVSPSFSRAILVMRWGDFSRASSSLKLS